MTALAMSNMTESIFSCGVALGRMKASTSNIHKTLSTMEDTFTKLIGIWEEMVAKNGDIRTLCAKINLQKIPLEKCPNVYRVWCPDAPSYAPISPSLQK